VTEDEIETLRAENAQLREQLAGARRECEILHQANRGIAGYKSGARRSVEVVQVGSRERMALLEHTVDVLDGFVVGVAAQDCYDYCEPDDKCQPCRARETLDAIKLWRYGGSTEMPSRRYEGAMFHRTQMGVSWPREVKIHKAWVKHMGMIGRGADHTLGMILTDRSPGQPAWGHNEISEWPTPRDWYVATSIVQWLVTNVGMGILEDAGFKYTQWDEDRVAYDDAHIQRQMRAVDAVQQEIKP